MNHELQPYIVSQPKGIDGTVFGLPYQSIAASISSWTKGEHMLPKSPGDIETLFAEGLSVVVFDATQPVGHAAITTTYDDTKHIEIGTVVVAPDMRGKQIGTVATHAILTIGQQKFPDYTPMAMANAASAKLFEKFGATAMDTTVLSPDVFSFCVTCPKRPPQPADGSPKCCDTPYDLRPMLTSFGFGWLSLYVWKQEGGTS